MDEKRALADDGGGVLAAEVCFAGGCGTIVSRGCGDAVERRVPLAGGEARRCAGPRDCAWPRRVVRFELCTGNCGQGVGAGISFCADESEELRRDGAADANLIQQRVERGLPRDTFGIYGRGIYADLFCGIFDGREFGEENGGGERGGGACGSSGGGRG